MWNLDYKMEQKQSTFQNTGGKKDGKSVNYRMWRRSFRSNSQVLPEQRGIWGDLHCKPDEVQMRCAERKIRGNHQDEDPDRTGGCKQRGLDLFAREAIFQLIHQIKQMEKAPTILFVTHHAEEITKSFSHVLLLKEGQSFAQGPKEEILTQETLSAFYGGKVQLIPIGEDRYYIQPDQ